MKKVVIVLCLLSGVFNSFFATTKDSIAQKINQINKWLICLDTLQPFREGEQELIDSLNTRVESELINVLNDEQVGNYKLETVFKLRVTKSADDKVFIFSFDEKTGGSYKSNVNIIHYRYGNRKTKTKRLKSCQNESNYGGVCNTINVLKKNKTTSYLVLGAGIGCATCEFHDAFLVQIIEGELKTNFCLRLDFRQGDGKLNYNTKSKLLSYQYTINTNDSQYATDCSDGEAVFGTKLCKYKKQFKFNGSTFVEIMKK